MRRSRDGTCVVGYVRVSTDEQADSGLGLAAQRTTIRTECDRRGWRLLALHEDAGASGRSINRPALQAALSAVDCGEAGALIVAKFDRLTRSVLDGASLLARAKRDGWALVALDLGVDTTTPTGEAMAHMLVTFGQLERRMIGERTRDALAVKRSQGVRLGRPRALPSPVLDRIVAERDRGESWSAIARRLDADSIPTAHGGARWYPATVRAAYESVRGGR